MRWLLMSLQNAMRRKLRTAVTAAGVAIGIAALFSLLAFEQGYQNGIRMELDHLGAHVLVAPKGCPYDAASIALHGASWPCYLKEDYVTRVRNTGGVATAAPLLMNAVYEDKTGASTVYLGAESGLLALKHNWHITGHFPVAAEDCLLGSTEATRLHLKIGDHFTLPGIALKSGTALGVVCGIVAPTNDSDDTFITVPLTSAQALFNRPKQLTHMLVRLTDPNMLDRVVADLRGCDAGMDMNVVPLAHVFHTIQDLVNSTRILLGCVALVALLTAGAGVSNTILMAVTERTREIGVMRAVGASQFDIFRLVWIETISVCLFGGIVGLLAGGLGAPFIETWLRARLPFSPTAAMVHADPTIMGTCLLCAIMLGTFAGLLPAFRAARLSPVTAIGSLN